MAMTDAAQEGKGTAKSAIMAIEDFAQAVEWQARHAAEAGAPCTARVIRALLPVRESDTLVGHQMRAWDGLTLKDAMPLRITGGLHHLSLTGADNRLEPVYSGAITDQAKINALVLALTRDHDARLAGWLDGPPQTNEAGRSASIMAAILWLAERIAPRFELIELGASAGINTMIDRYFFDLGGVKAGPGNSPMKIVPEWRGTGMPPAPPADLAFRSVRGCDIAPIDLTDPAAALRLKAYVWPDARERMARIDAAIALASQRRPDVVEEDAADFVTRMFAAPQAPGTTRALFHSIMWQYLPAETQAAITDTVLGHAASATPDRPIAWIALETDPATFRHELKVRYWNGSGAEGAPHLLAVAHPHGAWVEWLQ